MIVTPGSVLAREEVGGAPQAAASELTVAQDTRDGKVIDEILVVGTAIKGTPVDSAHAVTSIEMSDLGAGGATTLQDFFKALPSSHGVLGERSSAFNSNQFNTIDASVGNVNLRGLGAARTLVLINGRRQVYLPARLIGGRFVDVNTIPTTAVERVEVLKEGAGAIYGSDALAGVVQFVTRSAFEGLEFSVTHEAIEDAGNSKFGVIWGGNIGEVHVTTTFEHERWQALVERDREYTLASYQPGQRGGWSSFGNPGAYLLRDADRSVSSVVVDPQCEDFGGVDAGFTCRYRYQSFFNLIEETEFNRVFTELQGELDNGIRYYLELLYAATESPDVLASPSYPFVTLLATDVLEIGAKHPGRIAVCEEFAAIVPECAEQRPWYFRGRSIGNSGPASSVSRDSDSFRISGGLDGEFEFADQLYSYDLAVTWSRQEAKMSDSASYTERLFLAFRGYGGPDCGVGVLAVPDSPAKMRLNPADLVGRVAGEGNCEYFNPFGNAIPQSAQPSAPLFEQHNPYYRQSLSNSEAIRSWLTNELVLNSESELLVLDLLLGREWIPDFLTSATGYQYRRFDAAGIPDDESSFNVHPCQVRFDTSCRERDRFGPYAFTSTWDPYDVDQSVHRAFVELAFAFEQVDLQLALNYEIYDESSSVDPKFALSWRVHPLLTLRTTAQTTFRTPSVDQLNPDKLTTLEFVSQTGTYIPVDRIGSPDLQPESATTYNFGAVFFLGSDIDASIDYWHYDFQDVIDAAPHNSVVDLYDSMATRQSVATSIICPEGRASVLIAEGAQPCSAADLARVEIGLVNWPGIETSGLDFHIGGGMPLGAGQLRSSFDASYVLNFKVAGLMQNELVLEPARDAAGRMNFGHPLAPSLPEFKARLSASWLWREYTFSTLVSYISSYKDELPGSTGPRVDDYLSFDLAVQWETPVDGLRLSLSLLNATDAHAPFANLEQGFDGFTHSIKGRRAKLSVVYSPNSSP